jgi:hypothetical protein
MIAYHGSNSCFKNLRIHKSLVKSSATALNEGLGIYFSLDRDVASSYGKYMYTLEINDNYIKDFRVLAVCKKYIADLIKHIYRLEKIDISQYFDASSLVKYIYNGNTAISGIGREVYMLLDSNEKWYRLSQEKIDKVYKILEKYDENNLYAYLFNYNIRNIGVIKKIDDNIVRIVSRQKMY